MLDLDHHALPGFIHAALTLGDDTIETGAFEAVEPLDGQRTIVRRQRQVQRWCGCRKQLLERGAPFSQRECANVMTTCREQGGSALQKVVDFSSSDGLRSADMFVRAHHVHHHHHPAAAGQVELRA